MLLHAQLPMRDDAARGKKSRELPQAAPSAAAPRTRVREEQQPHQRGAPGLRRLQPPAAHGGCRAAPRPALLVPSDATARGKGPGSCLRPPPVPLHQEPGSERSSSRTTGAHLAPDGPHLQRPRGLSCCSSPSCSSPATPPCAEQSPGRCIRCFLVPLHQEPGSERSSSRTRGAHLASDGPQLQGPRGLSTIRRPAVRAQRRRRAWNVVQGAAPGRSQCRCRQSSSSAGERRLQSSTAKRCHFESRNSRACYRDSLHQSVPRAADIFEGKPGTLWCND